MSLTAGVAAFAGVFASIVALKQKRHAEREFLIVLGRETASTRLREIRSKIMEDGAVSSSELQDLIASLETLTHELAPQHRPLIKHGLRQKSIRGRARYAAKLMNGAGIGSGSLPVAMP